MKIDIVKKIVLAALALCALALSTHAQSQVGLSTRFGTFSNNAYWGPGNTNTSLVLTNTQSYVAWTNGTAEIPIQRGRGLALAVNIATTNSSASSNQNVATFWFDVSPFGTANKTAGFAGFNTNFATGWGAYSNYTGTNFWSWAVTAPWSNNNVYATNIPHTILDNWRYIRLSSVVISTEGAPGQVTIGDPVWSYIP